MDYNVNYNTKIIEINLIQLYVTSNAEFFISVKSDIISIAYNAKCEQYFNKFDIISFVLTSYKRCLKLFIYKIGIILK